MKDIMKNKFFSKNKKINRSRLIIILVVILSVIGISLYVANENIHNNRKKEIENAEISIKNTSFVFGDYALNLKDFLINSNASNNKKIEDNLKKLEEENERKQKEEQEKQRIIEKPSGNQTVNHSNNNRLPISENKGRPGIGENYSTIQIPSVGLNSVITYGDDQSQIDNNDICQRNTGSLFGENGSKIIMGHNNKSLSLLFSCSVGNQINFHTGFGDFTYKIDSIEYGTVDTFGSNIVDSSGSRCLINFYESSDIIYFYTCVGSQLNTNQRLVVKCSRI